MTIDRLRYFCAIAATGSMRSAAELLSIAPATLSKAMKQLQLEVGQELLLPAGRGVRLSERGRQFARAARRVIDEHDRLRAEVALEMDRGDLIRLGIPGMFASYALPELMRALGNVALHVSLAEARRVTDGLLDMSFDVGITSFPIPAPGIENRFIGDMTLSVYATAGAIDSWGDGPIPHVGPLSTSIGAPAGAVEVDGWPTAQFRDVRYRVQLLQSGLEICRSGAAAALLPDFLVHRFNEVSAPLGRLFAVPSTPVTSKPVHLLKREDGPEDPYLHRLTTCVGEMLAPH